MSSASRSLVNKFLIAPAACIAIQELADRVDTALSKVSETANVSVAELWTVLAQEDTP